MSTVPILLPVSLLLPPVALPTRNFAYRCDWKPDTSLPLPPSLSASLSLSVCVMTQDIVTARMHRFVLLPNALFPCLNATCDTHVTVRLIPDMHRRSDGFRALTLLLTLGHTTFTSFRTGNVHTDYSVLRSLGKCCDKKKVKIILIIPYYLTIPMSQN